MATYNGKHLLEEYLPYLKEALNVYPHETEIVLVDDGSTDGTAEFIARRYHEIRYFENPSNIGFIPTANMGVREAKHDIVILLNNDVRVEKDFIAPLVRHFDDPAVFAVVSASIVNIDGRLINESVTVPRFEEGLLYSHQPMVFNPDLKIDHPCTNLHASGGFGAFDRKKFMELDGFDEIFHPYYYEDVDIAYRAWKRGWQVLYEPGSVVYHRSHATIGNVATAGYINTIEQRNKFLFTWKNLSDPHLILSHIRWLAVLSVSAFLPGRNRQRYLIKCLLMALKRLPIALRNRARNSKYIKLSDRRVFYLASNKETTTMKFNRFLNEDGFDTEKGPRILLIDPTGYQKGLNIGLAYLAGSLKKNNLTNVEVLDLNNVFPDMPEERLIQLIEKRGYNIIGFSIKTPTYKVASEVSRITRRHFPQIVHIAGGPHITLNYKEFIRENEQFDYLVVGEGEYSFVELCRMLASGKEYPIDGVVGRSEIHSSPLKVNFIPVLDELPYPDFDVFRGYDFTDFEYPIVTSRGCPYMCTYCSVGLISGKRMRFRDVARVIEELRWAMRKFDTRKFNIIDDNFTIDVKRAKLFCDRLIEEMQGFEWACGNGIRADRVDKELAEKMKRSGCRIVCIGVENADQRVFNTLKKGESLEDIKNGIGILKDAGIEVVGFFIIGLPGDNKKSSEMALKFVKESRLDSARFGILLPYPKTEVYDWIVENGRFLRDYKEGIHFSDSVSPVFETEDFSAAEMVETYKRLYTRLNHFTFLLPVEITDAERIKRILRLAWKYDKASFIRIPLKHLRAVLAGFIR
ncbi:MAG: glycosyltransferase [Deltaproteobacteria bacterium]|nr:glycosyltransferase [Deltaproteobacteria bacterium]